MKTELNTEGRKKHLEDPLLKTEKTPTCYNIRDLFLWGPAVKGDFLQHL